MKTAVLFLSGLLLSAFASGPAAAEPVRVRLTARVFAVSDPNNELAGKIVPGQRVNGIYAYNTNTPNLSPIPGSGRYHTYANEYRLRFVAGSLVFESTPTDGIMIFVNSGNGIPNSGDFILSSTINKPLADGTIVDSIFVDFRGSGNVTQSGALPTVAPDLSNYWKKEVTISGGSFELRAQIETAELIETAAIKVSPAAGSFVANQHFDAALTLPRNSVVASMQATANGMQLPLSYPGICQLQAPNSANKPSLVCPGADSVLPLAAGAPIEWTVTLTNGTVLTETVNWVRAQ